MKALVASLQANQGAAASNSGNADADRMIAELQAKLAEKQSDLAHSMGIYIYNQLSLIMHIIYNRIVTFFLIICSQ